MSGLRISLRRIKVVSEVTPMPKPKRPEFSPETEARIQKLLELVEEEVNDRGGPDKTFEERNDEAFEVLKEVLWRREDDELQGAVTTKDEVEADGNSYGRLNQSSSATYFGKWGAHWVEEALYREVGVHNGPTIKPIELRVGMISRHMTPDFARVLGALAAGDNSRDLVPMLVAVGMVPPSRAFLEKRVKEMAGEIVGQIAELEEVVRGTTMVPPGVASMSCGLDRFSVRMSEPLDPESKNSAPFRREPYDRTPPPPKEHHYRKAWVGSTTVYDQNGEALHTWRCGVEADADPNALAERVAADVAWVLDEHPGIPVHCVQDAAPELRALPEALTRTLSVDVVTRDLVDFEHLCGYLDDVVDACEDEGDPFNMKGWYRGELLRDDQAIDRIWWTLRDKARKLPRRNREGRNALAAALSYIRGRKDKMRYASHYAAKLPIGSGATESTCWEMQLRVKQPGQSWEVPGLSGMLGLRGLVLSGRWMAAWKPYAASHRRVVS
jgi:hypothetical protein